MEGRGSSVTSAMTGDLEGSDLVNWSFSIGMCKRDGSADELEGVANDSADDDRGGGESASARED